MAGPNRAVARARSALRAALADLGAGARVLVACSGGADSLALAATAAFVAPREGWSAGAVIVDHQLREGSAQVAERAAAQCRAIGLDPVTVRSPGCGGEDAREWETAAGPEGGARAVRYALLAEAAEEYGACAVLLGHSLDDQAETVLLRLARGSGARSLAGMPAERGRYRRPFLSLRRSETEEICRALELVPDQDETNQPDGPWRAADGSPLRRAAVRARVMPALTEALGPGVPEALARTAEQLSRDAELLESLAAELLATAILPADADADADADAERRAEPGPELQLCLDVDVLARAHPAVRTRALHAAALRAGATPGSLAAVHIDELESLVVRYHGQGPIPLPGGISARRIRPDGGCGRLSLCRSAQEAAG